MRLQDKVAVVTGVENEGIGPATAILFAAEGARVVVTEIDRETGSQVVAHIKKQGGEALSKRFVRRQSKPSAGWIF